MSMAAREDDASIALPFTIRPENLNGELVGDVGFDPLNFSEEVRHILQWEEFAPGSRVVRRYNPQKTALARLLRGSAGVVSYEDRASWGYSTQ